MSASNPMHHEPPARTPKAPAWPFPVQPLAYPLAPPIERPTRPTKPYPVNAPAAPF
jgi:hypothetical protein